jgi:hypothetical protein
MVDLLDPVVGEELRPLRFRARPQSAAQRERIARGVGDVVGVADALVDERLALQRLRDRDLLDRYARPPTTLQPRLDERFVVLRGENEEAARVVHGVGGDLADDLVFLVALLRADEVARRVPSPSVE